MDPGPQPTEAPRPATRGEAIPRASHTELREGRHLYEAAKWKERAEAETARANQLADKAGELETQRTQLFAQLGEQAERIRELERKLARR